MQLDQEIKIEKKEEKSDNGAGAYGFGKYLPEYWHKMISEVEYADTWDKQYNHYTG